MNQEPKSIWKKPLPLPKLLLVWLGLLAGTISAVGMVVLIINAPFPMGGVLIVSAVTATVLLALWISVRWLFSRRNCKRSLFGLACFVTLIAMFYAEEDWRGQHDWNQFKQKWVTKGERFDWQSIVPPPVPDNQNFAFSPVWIAEEKFSFHDDLEKAKAWYGNRIDSPEVDMLVPLMPVTTSAVVGTNVWDYDSKTPENCGTWQQAQFFDLKPWQTYYRDLGKTNAAVKISTTPQPQTPAQDVLLALSKFDPVFKQLRQDSGRPDSRFPIQYNDGMPAAILLPHLAIEKRLADVLQLRATAELQNGDSEEALGDVKLMLRLEAASRNEPFLICHLVRIAILNLTLQPVWEGLAKHQWTDAQLAELDSELAKLDYIADNKSAIRGERNLEIANIDFLRHPHDLDDLEFKRPRLYFLAPMLSRLQILSEMSSANAKEIDGFQAFALAIGPSGWLDQNALRVARLNTQRYLPVVDEGTKTISPAKMHAANGALKQKIRHPTPESVLEAAFIPNWNNAMEKFAHAQSVTDLARVAIALERYRLAHGEYPEMLNSVAPKFITKLPHDVIGGQPLHYRRTSDGLFVLYSVGWNETDDGGSVVLEKGSSPGVNISKGDWVWRYPEK